MDIKEIDAITGEVTEREYTKAEQADHDALVAKAKTLLDAEIAAAQAKATARAEILNRLGITVDEAAILLG
jgi:hypothetical protein